MNDPESFDRDSHERARKAVATATWRDKRYHFCSSDCRAKFTRDPWFYLSGNRDRQRAQETQARSTDHDGAPLFTCPMDPEIVQ